MNGETTKSAVGSAGTTRKPRPEIQIYRPGMLRKSTQNVSGGNEEKPPRPERLTTSEDVVTTSSGNRRRVSNDSESVTSRGGSGSTTPDANLYNERAKNRFSGGYNQHDRRENHSGGGSSYNSTQSLYDTRRQGGYTEYNGNRSNRGGGNGGRYQNNHPNSRREHFNRNFSERSSMRGDGAIAKRPTGGRRRNDSINSTQSEMPQTSSKNDQLHIDTNYDSVSQCGASSAYSMNSLGEAFSFEEMCQNLQNFASMDWSKEVENEYAMQREIEEAEEEEKRRLQEANGQKKKTSGSPKKQSRKNRMRYDESDRESSFGGSIAEENEPIEETQGNDGEEDVLKSGERTPTSVHSYSSRGPYILKKNRENEYGRRNTVVENKKKTGGGGYRGEHDDRDDETTQYDEIEHHMTSGRLAGRISIVPREHIQQENRNKNRPSKQSKSDEKGAQKHSSPEMASREVLNRRRKEEIDKVEGVKMRQLYEKIEKLAPTAKKRDVAAAEKMVDFSIELANTYQQVLLPDIVYTFTMGLEQKLFRQAFYKSIESLRSGSNSADPMAKRIRAILQKLLLNGILFYEKLIEKYEEEFKVKLEDALTWPSGFPTEKEIVEFSVDLPIGPMKYESSTQKTAIKSMSRHLISLGDLHRYKSLVDGSENYEVSKNCYLKSAQLWPATGHPYNQLGVVVYYSMLYRSARRARLVPVDVLSVQRQKRVIDEFFYLMRALGCSHPYEAAKDRLTQRLDAIRQKVAKYQPVLDKECGEVRRDSAVLKSSMQAVRQLWIHPTTQKVEDGTGERRIDDILAHFKSQSKTKLHRRAVSFLCDIFGMLVTKVGMDHFDLVSERGFGQLYAALSKPETDFSAEQLLKLSAMFIFAVHYNFNKSDVEQSQIAFRTLLTFYILLVKNYEKSIILPSINTISLWISHPETQKILENLAENAEILEILPSSILAGDEFSAKSTFSAILSEIPEEELEEKEKTFPEVVILSSFLKIFDSTPSGAKWTTNSEKSIKSINPTRIQMMRRAAEILLKFQAEKSENSEKSAEKSEKIDNSQKIDNEGPRSRQKMVEEERDKENFALIIHPEYLIPDTNVFISDLQLVKNLVNTKKYQVLVPTTVIDELNRLTHPSSSQSPREHDPERGNLAKQAIGWLREQTKLKNQGLFTLTTTGKRLTSLLMATENVEMEENTNNDDQILAAAVKWAETLPAPPTSSPLFSVVAQKTEKNYRLRTVVLLTGDRGLTIKSIGNQLPCRTIHSFCQWAGV